MAGRKDGRFAAVRSAQLQKKQSDFEIRSVLHKGGEAFRKKLERDVDRQRGVIGTRS